MSTPTPYPDDSLLYPDSDGQPMAESDFQRDYLVYAVEALRIHFQNRPDVYVSANLFIYYEKGNPKAIVAPDVFIVIGAPNHKRRSYLLWKEPKAPDFVLEITSHSTRSEDQGTKRGLYAYLGVQEYWQYDPTGDYLDPPLQGYHLVGQNYEPIASQVAGKHLRNLHSRVLDLDLRTENGELRFHDAHTGRRLLSHAEAELARREAEARAEEETARRLAAEARLAELQARLNRLESGQSG